jgi:hypothetical protein
MLVLAIQLSRSENAPKRRPLKTEQRRTGLPEPADGEAGACEPSVLEEVE